MISNGCNCFHAFLNSVSQHKSKVRLISELSYLALGQIQKLRQTFLSFRTDLNSICVISNSCNCFHPFLNRVSEQKSNVRLISEISEFSYSALGQIGKLGNLGKIFLTIRKDLRFISNSDLQLWQLFTCFS